jgi:hypothetical protein
MLALASLPLHPKTRRPNAVANQLPPGVHLLALQDLLPEQRKAAPAEVVDAARFAAPLNLFGGHRFANAPELDAETRRAIRDAEIDPPGLAEVASSPICPDAPIGGDLGRIPPFLDRRPPAGAPSLASAVSSAGLSPADESQKPCFGVGNVTKALFPSPLENPPGASPWPAPGSTGS